jgi:hypothetical protein
MNEVKSGVGVASRAIVPGFRCASSGYRCSSGDGSDFAARDHGDAGPTAGLT